MSAQLIELTDLGLLKISGTDAAKFLQGQLTCDVNLIDAKHSGFTAYCNVKGRVIVTANIFFFEEAYFLCLAKNLLCKTITLLTKYKLAAKVKLEDVTEQFKIFGVIGEPNSLDANIAQLKPNENYLSEDAFITRLARNDILYLVVTKINNNSLLAKLNSLASPAALNTWHLALISNYVPIVFNEISEMFTPEMLNLVELGAVSFTKGCYIGQEIIARTHHLGKTKRVLARAQVNSPQKPALATKIVNSNHEEIGDIILIAENNINRFSLLIVLTEAGFNNRIFLPLEKNILTEISNIKSLSC